MKDTIKKRITKKDWNSVEDFISGELDKRKASSFRKKHEAIWKEVDRQVAMDPMQRVARGDGETDWHSAIELGELSRASEILTADIRRMTFPHNRAWADYHSDLMAEEGVEEVPRKVQKIVDGRVRAMSMQQLLDFGFKSRVDLSVKEALHHGSYVVTVEEESAFQVVNGQGIKTLSAPVWKPHSMWNCYPDSSQGVAGHNTFYQGSMIIEAFKPAYQVRQMKSGNPEYPYFNLDKIKDNNGQTPEDGDDVTLTYYYGDLVMPRQRNNILLLNSRAILANGTIIHYQPNPMPYPEIVYNGWERLDVRDPYYVSPIVKFSPTQKLGSILANRLVDSIDLKTEPPVIYDGNDPDFQLNGGPTIAPGAKSSTKGTANYEVMDVGDPSAALAGTQFMISQLEAGTKVDRTRSGVAAGTEQTATEVIKQSQSGELSTMDFVDKHELHGLRPALYMMYELNKKNLTSYPFYNQEMEAPDFEVMKRSELPDNVNIDIVGSRGLIGEERRQAATSQVTAFWMGVAPEKLNIDELIRESYRDAGNKKPESFLVTSDEAAQQVQQQIQQVAQQAQEQIGALQEAMQKFQFQDEEHSIELEQKDLKLAQKDIQLADKELEKEGLQNKIGVLTGLQRLESEVKKNEPEAKPEKKSIKVIYENGKPVGAVMESSEGTQNVDFSRTSDKITGATIN